MSSFPMYNKEDGANNNSFNNKNRNNIKQDDKSKHGGITSEDLCCCEYINSQGERSHLMGLFCDCSELDDAVDRLFKGLSIPSSRPHEIMSVIEDRFRIPWKGGARKVRLDLVLPWIIVPFNLLFCSINLVCLLIIHGIVMPLTMYLTYRFCLRSVRPQTKFFISWSLSTFFYLFCIYQYQIVGLMSLPKIISPWENLCLILFIAGALYAVFTVKDRASYQMTIDDLKDENWNGGNNVRHLGAKQDNPQKNDYSINRHVRYCRICQHNVPGKDHHCVWVDACISHANIYPFISFLVCIFLTLIHAGFLFLTSVCDNTALTSLLYVPWSSEFKSSALVQILVPVSCWDFNPTFSGNPGLTFAAGAHCICLSIPVFLLLCHKLYSTGRGISR